LQKGSKNNNFVTVFKYYGTNNPKNHQKNLRLTPGSNFHCTKQVQDTYLAVSMDQHLEIFSLLTFQLVRIIKTDTPFQFIVRANDDNLQFGMHDTFVQEAVVGYNYGSFLRCGIVATRENIQAKRLK